MCQRLRSFYDAYIQKKAYLNYCGLDRARRFEGAGCAIFGAGVIDVGGFATAARSSRRCGPAP